MEYALIFILAAVAYYYFIMKKAGNLDFWKKAAQNPGAAMMFFTSNSHWYIDEKPQHSVTGPYLFQSPLHGRTVKLYCDADYEKETQDEYIRSIS